MDGREEVYLTVSFDDRPVGDEVLRPGASLGPDVPLEVAVRREGRSFVLHGENVNASVSAAEAAVIHAGRLTLTARVIRRFRLPRWIIEPSHLVLPLLMLACGIFARAASHRLRAAASSGLTRRTSSSKSGSERGGGGTASPRATAGAAATEKIRSHPSCR
jgi:hypothetical protein